MGESGILTLNKPNPLLAPVALDSLNVGYEDDVFNGSSQTHTSFFHTQHDLNLDESYLGSVGRIDLEYHKNLFKYRPEAVPPIIEEEAPEKSSKQEDRFILDAGRNLERPVVVQPIINKSLSKISDLLNNCNIMVLQQKVREISNPLVISVQVDTPDVVDVQLEDDQEILINFEEGAGYYVLSAVLLAIGGLIIVFTGLILSVCTFADANAGTASVILKFMTSMAFPLAVLFAPLDYVFPSNRTHYVLMIGTKIVAQFVIIFIMVLFLCNRFHLLAYGRYKQSLMSTPPSLICSGT